MINRLVDDMLVKILPAGAHSVFEIVQAEYREYDMLCCRALVYSVINWAQVWAVEGHTDGSINFKKTFFFVCKQFASL